MKFLTLMIIIIGTIFIFNMAGFTTNSGTFIKGMMDNGFGYFTTSEFWIDCSGLSDCASSIPIMLTIGVTAGAIAGLFGRSPDVSYVTGGAVFAITSILVIEMGVLWNVVSPHVAGWIKNFVGGVMLIMTITLLYSVINWFRGVDN